MLSGALLELVDARYGPTAAYAALFIIAFALRFGLSVAPSGPGTTGGAGLYVSAVVLRAVRWRVRERPLTVSWKHYTVHGRTPVCSIAILIAAYALTIHRWRRARRRSHDAAAGLLHRLIGVPNGGREDDPLHVRGVRLGK